MTDEITLQPYVNERLGGNPYDQFGLYGVFVECPGEARIIVSGDKDGAIGVYFPHGLAPTPACARAVAQALEITAQMAEASDYLARLDIAIGEHFPTSD